MRHDVLWGLHTGMNTRQYLSPRNVLASRASALPATRHPKSQQNWSTPTRTVGVSTREAGAPGPRGKRSLPSVSPQGKPERYRRSSSACWGPEGAWIGGGDDAAFPPAPDLRRWATTSGRARFPLLERLWPERGTLQMLLFMFPEEMRLAASGIPSARDAWANKAEPPTDKPRN